MTNPLEHFVACTEIGRQCANYSIAEISPETSFDLVLRKSLEHDTVKQGTNQAGSLAEFSERYPGLCSIASDSAVLPPNLTLAESHLILAYAEMVEAAYGGNKTWLSTIQFARQHLQPPVRIIQQLSMMLNGPAIPECELGWTIGHDFPSHWWWQRQFFRDGSEAILPVAPRYGKTTTIYPNFFHFALEFGIHTLCTMRPFSESSDEYLVNPQEDVHLLAAMNSPLLSDPQLRQSAVMTIRSNSFRKHVGNALLLTPLSLNEWMHMINVKPQLEDQFLRESKFNERNIATYLVSRVGRITRAKFEDAFGKLHRSRIARQNARDAYKLLKAIYPHCHYDPNGGQVSSDTEGMEKALAAEFKRMGLL